MKTTLDEVLSVWRSQAKIASMLDIDEDDVWEKVFTGRKIIQKRTYGSNPFSYITLYKEVSDETRD